MAITVPTLSRTMDTKFVQTFFKIQKEAIDNVLLGTPVTAAIRLAGCFKPQTGSRDITGTIRHTVGPTPQDVDKGDTLPSGEVETRTELFHTFRKTAGHCQRTIYEDDDNQGPEKISDYVSDRLEETMDALKQKFETDWWRAHVTDESGKSVQGLNDLIPPAATRSTGTYGGITRAATFSADAFNVVRGATGNVFQGGVYKQLVAPYEANLVSDMNTLFNGVSNNVESPNLLISDQGLYELYQNAALNMSQIVKESGTQFADLGFEAIRFNGKRWLWTTTTNGITANNMLMLNTNHIDCIYSPTMWFARTDWKWLDGTSDTRIMHILCKWNTRSKQLRRHARLYA